MPEAQVIGAGLAGAEAAWQLLSRGVHVRLHEMKPRKRSPAHSSDLFAELVCSNSLRSNRLQNAVGLLKEEMRRMGSLVMRAADASSVPAGGALAVDREQFSRHITEALRSHPRLTVVEGEVTEFPEGNSIIATGPLTSDAFAQAIQALPQGAMLHFYDAAAPIVTAESLDMDRVFSASRYGRGDDYLNCPMDEAEYRAFHQALLTAETAPVHGFEEERVFEGCMPVESLARRGEMALAFGPLKPVGLTDPRTGRQPFAVLQLRQEDASGSLYNLVGFQTRLKFSEQKRVFGMIPGLAHSEYARYGVMHRNSFLHSPGFLDESFRMIGSDNVYFAGQITGVEGYVESAASGLLAGLHLAHRLHGLEAPVFPGSTALGALARYVSTPNRSYQPMHICFGLVDPLRERIRNKQQRHLRISELALHHLDSLRQAMPLPQEDSHGA